MEGDKWIAMTGRSNGRTMGGGEKEADAEREMGRNAGRIAKGAKTTGPELEE